MHVVCMCLCIRAFVRVRVRIGFSRCTCTCNAPLLCQCTCTCAFRERLRVPTSLQLTPPHKHTPAPTCSPGSGALTQSFRICVAAGTTTRMGSQASPLPGGCCSSINSEGFGPAGTCAYVCVRMHACMHARACEF